MAYVLGHPWVTSVVVGAEREQDVRANLALAGRDPLTAAQCVRVRHTVPAGSAELVDPSRWGAP
jgi:aryl-alcohol dehydrogenase-like predicted oxidoreductase